MKTITRLLVLVGAWLVTLASQAQRPDSLFNVDVWKYGEMHSLAVSPQGRTAVFGTQHYSDGRLLGNLTVFDAQGQPDLAFQQAAGIIEAPGIAADLPGLLRFYPDGRLLLACNNDIFCSQSAQVPSVVLRLLPTGAPDNSFRLSPTMYRPTIRTVAVQPDGKVLLAGSGNMFSGVGPLIRLNADGSQDNSFMANIGGRSSDYISTLAVQPDGKILVGGLFVLPAPALVRLLPNGQLDATFQAGVSSGHTVKEILVRPTGEVLVAGAATLTVQGQAGGLHQLLPTGRRDASFQAPAGYGFVKPGDGRQLHLLRNGRLLVLPTAPAGLTVQRLQASGSLDASFQAFAQWPVAPRTAALDTAGVLVVGGAYQHQRPLISPLLFSSPLLRMQPSGQLSSAFAPQLYLPGLVLSMVEQPGLGVVLAGDFDVVNGYPAPNLVRLKPGLPDIDTAFVDRMPHADRLDLVAVQPPGNGLLLGGFGQVDGAARGGFVQLAANGQLSTTFRRYPAGYNSSAVAVQPDGRFIVGGEMARLYARCDAARFLANGDYDPAFSVAQSLSLGSRYKILAQPDGRILLLGTPHAVRVQANGQYDPSFVPAVLTSNNSTLIEDAVLQSNGRLTLCGQMPPQVAGQVGSLLRLLPNGQRDTTLADPQVRPAFRPRSLTYRPDGRLVVGCSYFQAPLQQRVAIFQLQPNGTLDNSFAVVSGVGDVFTTLLTSRGRLLAGGRFYYFANSVQQQLSVMAFVAAQPLAAAPPTPLLVEAVYPNPAHDQLHLQLDAGANPQRLTLLNVLGRPVLRQSIGAPELTLATSGLPPGTYLLRVEYAHRASTHRIVLE